MGLSSGNPRRIDVPAADVRVLTILWRLSEGGGVPIVVRRIASGLDASVRMDVVTARPDDLGDGLDALPVTVHALGHRGGQRPLERLKVALGVARLARTVTCGVVHVHGGAPWLWVPARLAKFRTPFVLEVHDAPGSGRHSAATDRLEGLLVRLFRMPVIAHSSSVGAAVRARWKVDERRLHVFPLAVDTVTSTPTATADQQHLRHRLGLPPSSPVLLGVGRLAPPKRFHLAVAVLSAVRRRHPDAVLVIVGGGQELEPLLRHARESGVEDAVRIEHRLTPEDLAQLMAGADVLISTSEYEGFGLVLAEAAAAGTPAVVMDVGGVGDVIVDGVTGYLTPSGDVDAMAAKVVHLLADDGLRARMGAAARARAEQEFSVPTMVSRFVQVYRTCARS